VRPTVFYRGDGEELAFFVEDARKAGGVIRLDRIPMQDPVLREIAFDLNPGNVRQKALQRNNTVSQPITDRNGVLHAEVS